MRRYYDDGRHPLLPGELPEKFVVDVEWTLSRDVGVGHVVAVDEGEEDRVLPGHGVHAEAGEFTCKRNVYEMFIVKWLG